MFLLLDILKDFCFRWISRLCEVFRLKILLLFSEIINKFEYNFTFTSVILAISTVLRKRNDYNFVPFFVVAHSK